MADKSPKLSITIRTVDQATAKIRAINARLDTLTKPTRDFKKALSELREKSGLDGVIGGFKGVGNAISGVLSKIGMIGGIVAAAVYGLKSLVDEFDALGDLSERVGIGVDAIAQLRYAADHSGASVEQLDQGLLGLSKNLGLARAKTGGLHSFLSKVSPVLLKQVKAAKSNEEAFGLLADAMVKIKDPAKRAAFAQKTLGDAALAPMLAKGSKGLKELRDEHLKLAGPQEAAVKAAGETSVAMKKLRASSEGVKAALVTGLAPALTIVVQRLTEWFGANRERIAEWAKRVGEELPAAIEKVVMWVGRAYDKVRAFVDMVGGLRNVAIGAAAIMAGPLIGSIVSLSAALLTAIGRSAALAKGLMGVNGAAGAAGASKLGALGPIGLAVGGAALVNELTGGGVGEGKKFGGGAMKLAQEAFDAGTKLEALKDQGRTELTDAVFKGMEAALRSGPAEQAETKIVVDFANVPKGTRVSTDPQGTADVDLSVGYQMIPGAL